MPQLSVDQKLELIRELYTWMIPIKAIAPSSGGDGEKARADFICDTLESMGYNDFQRVDIIDGDGKTRSNVILKVGNFQKTVWFVSHIDTVPEGSAELWKYPPFQAVVEGNRIYGRGTGDDGHAVVLSLLLLKDLDRGRLKYNVGLAFCADEELGSKYGIQALLEKPIFGKDDIIIVPDYGTESGLIMEVAEKSILWFKVTIHGKQFHASRPEEAVNSSREGMKFILELDELLHQKYNARNSVFEPDVSTFEPTKHEANVANINTIPGLDVYYVDCRVLPQYDLDEVLSTVNRLARQFEARSRATIEIGIVQKEQSVPGTDPSTEVVTKLSRSIEKVKMKKPTPVGIGGGTCAQYFRMKGIPAVAWMTAVDEVFHQPNEYVVVDYILSDLEILEDLIYNQ
ncbi:MAG: M20 family metallo-hydrolase [Candidatus Thermoplasmatota archaeon]|jgi:succinyl-diaminopimelate desuccinylase|nr:M20 family metallo-hydrolase [Candidatus Thermoplasmatota archaeon]